jgi:CRISPR-associated exonuclease Cas4
VSDGLSALLVVVVMAASAALYVLQRAAEASADERGMPRELCGAELAFAEQTFRSPRRRLVARLDRAYRVGGELLLVELKTRKRDAVRMSDVIELSVQRIVVQDQTKEPVSSTAWVVVENANTGVRKPHKVHLLGTEEVGALTERYRFVMTGLIRRPSPSPSQAMCRNCGHLARCAGEFGDRQ